MAARLESKTEVALAVGMLPMVCDPPFGTLKPPVNGRPGPVPQSYVPVKAAGIVAPSGLLVVLAIVNEPRSRLIEFWTVIVNVLVVSAITIDAGSYVGVTHV